MNRPSTSSFLAWLSLALAAATFVTLAVSLIHFADESRERSVQLQEAANTNQELLRQVRTLAREAKREGEQRRLDIRAFARRNEELHDSDPENSPFEPRGKGEKGDDETSDAGPEGSERKTGRTNPENGSERNSDGGKDPSGGNKKRPRDREPDEPDDEDELKVCAPAIGCLP